MTISLAPQLEKRLRWKAARTGQDTNTLAEEILSDALGDEVSEDELREEYHQLIKSSKETDPPLGGRGIASCLPKAYSPPFV